MGTAKLRITRMESLYADYLPKVPLSGLPSETIPGTYRVPTHLEGVDTYVFPPGRLPISPQFVPREDSASDTDGYTWSGSAVTTPAQKARPVMNCGFSMRRT